MKQFIFSTLVVVGVFAFISCERHEWEDKDGDKGTKRLYPKEEKKDHGAEHGKEGHEDHAGHDHADHADHADHGSHDDHSH